MQGPERNMSKRQQLNSRIGILKTSHSEHDRT